MKNKEEIKNLIDIKFNNKFYEFIRNSRIAYIKAISEYRSKPWAIRDFINWKFIEQSLADDIPNIYDYICKYDISLGIPKEDEVSFFIDMQKDEDFSKIYYFSCGDIHKISVEMKDGKIEDGFEEFYFPKK